MEDEGGKDGRLLLARGQGRVYVDVMRPCRRTLNWRYDYSCHLMAFPEDFAALWPFAKGIGMREDWFQLDTRSLPHFDLTFRRRAAAVAAGAVEIASHAEQGQLFQAWREADAATCPGPVGFDQQQLTCGRQEPARHIRCQECGLVFTLARQIQQMRAREKQA